MPVDYFSASFYLLSRVNVRIGTFFSLRLGLFATFVLVSHVQQICVLMCVCVVRFSLIFFSSLSILFEFDAVLIIRYGFRYKNISAESNDKSEEHGLSEMRKTDRERERKMEMWKLVEQRQ